MNQQEKILQKYLYREACNTRTNRIERIKDIRYYDNLTPIAEKSGGELGYGNDAPRINTIREKIDWSVGHILSKEMITRVIGAGKDENNRRVAEFREWQIKSQHSAANMRRKIERVLIDAALSGEGIMRLRVKPVMNGRAIITAERRNWRGVFYDTAWQEDDFSESRYLFDLSFIDFDELKFKHPGKKQKLKEFETEVLADRNPDQLLANSYGYFGNTFGDNGDDNFSSEGEARREVLYGLAWWRENEKGYPGGRVYWAEVAVSPCFGKVCMLTPKKPGYEMNEFPYIRIVTARYNESGYVYSPIPRFRRGIQRMMDIVFRSIIKLSGKNSMAVSEHALPKSMSLTPRQWIENAKEFVEGDSGILVAGEVGKEHMLNLDNSAKLDKMVNLFSTLMTSSEITGISIDPSLLGQRTNINSAVALQEKARQVQFSMSQLTSNYQECMRLAGGMTLSMIRQFEPFLHFPPYSDSDGGEFSPSIPQGIDYDLEAQSMYYDVVPRPAMEHNEYMMKMMTELAKTDPRAAPSLFLIMNHVSQSIPDSMMKRVAKQFALAGHAIPPEMLTQADRDEIRQEQENVKRQAEMASQIENAGAMAEIGLKKASAIKTETEAKVLAQKIETQNREIRHVEAKTEKAEAEAFAIEVEARRPPEKKNKESGWKTAK